MGWDVIGRFDEDGRKMLRRVLSAAKMNIDDRTTAGESGLSPAAGEGGKRCSWVRLKSY
jgi:hypothetical protein